MTFRLFLFFLLLSPTLLAQPHHLPPGDPSYHLLERYEVRSGLEAPWIGALHAVEGRQAVRYALRADSLLGVDSPLSRYRRRFVLAQWNDYLAPDGPQQALRSTESPHYLTTEKALFGALYRTPAFLYETNSPDFYLRANPLLDLRLGRDQEEGSLLFFNRRGLELRGAVDSRLYFFTRVTETQARFPAYVNRRIARDQAVPGNGFYKNYRSGLLDLNDAYDFLNAQGYVGFHLSPHIGLRFGTGRHFIGYGQRSLLLSDFSNNYLYLQLNTRVGRFHYQNLFAELTAASNTFLPGDVALPRKYLAAHYLGIRIDPKLEIGLYEAVVFSRNNRFDLSYLNPFIFYRAVEQAAGSPDNVLLGLNLRGDLLRHFRCYGQLVLDEFKLDELITDNNGWWANKFGWQLGLKYFDAFGREDLQLQVEYNTVRPYTYSHRDSSARYTHYRQPLAHPLGANFREFLALARWQPLPRWRLQARALWMHYGEDESSRNWGHNPLLSSNTRVQEYGNSATQGVDTRSLLIGAVLSHELFHNAFLEFELLYRDQDSALPERDLRTLIFSAGFRMNVSRREWTPGI